MQYERPAITDQMTVSGSLNNRGGNGKGKGKGRGKRKNPGSRAS